MWGMIQTVTWAATESTPFIVVEFIGTMAFAITVSWLPLVPEWTGWAL